MIFVGVGIWTAITILLIIFLDAQGAAGLYRSIALAGPYAVPGIIVSVIFEKLTRYKVSDSWEAIIAGLFYVSLIVASVAFGSFVTWAVLRLWLYLTCNPEIILCSS